MPKLRSTILLLLTVCLLGACRGEEAEKGETAGLRAPRHVFLITVDTLRADHLSAYGYARATSPNLDR
ncbi:MAG TPA: hypothetical protein VL025_08785, partial [Thermoanaerobaculia bacterium]|nr:hypothetical protein [Thermoanaerobaculia bacterium]